MKLTLSIAFFLLSSSFAIGQKIDKWYSESTHNGIRIENSLPKGGPYPGPTQKFFNYSYLVFYNRITNQNEIPVEININFYPDSINIPNSPDTFVKLFLPPDTMTLEKQSEFSYGIMEIASFDEPTYFQKTLNPKEDCLFYVVGIFYQTKSEAIDQDRGGNRGEFILKGEDLYYKMPPQIDSMFCGRITFIE